MEPEHSLPHSQVPAICPCPEPDQSSPCPHIPLPEDSSVNCRYYSVVYKKFCSQLMKFVSFSIERNLTVPPTSHLTSCTPTKSNLHCSRKVTVAQSKHCPFGVDTTTEAQNVTTSNNNGICRCLPRLRSVPVLSDVVVIFFSSNVALTPNGNFLVFPVLHSVSDILTIHWLLSSGNLNYTGS